MRGSKRPFRKLIGAIKLTSDERSLYWALCTMQAPPLYPHHCSPSKVISHCVRLYFHEWLSRDSQMRARHQFPPLTYIRLDIYLEEVDTRRIFVYAYVEKERNEWKVEV